MQSDYYVLLDIRKGISFNRKMITVDYIRDGDHRYFQGEKLLDSGN